MGGRSAGFTAHHSARVKIMEVTGKGEKEQGGGAVGAIVTARLVMPTTDDTAQIRPGWRCSVRGRAWNIEGAWEVSASATFGTLTEIRITRGVAA